MQTPDSVSPQRVKFPTKHSTLPILVFILFALMAPVAFADVLINEVDADQVSTDSAEFIELYDGGAGNTDLSGLSLVLYNGSDDLSYIAFDLDGQSTDGDGYFVLCGNAANVASCDLDVSPDTNLIQNGADAVALLAGDAVNYPNDTALPTDSDIIDAVVYDTDDSDDAGLLVLLNAGQPQINERGGGDGTGHSNQRCPNGSGGARNTDTYTQAAPTPGATNCQAPPPATDVIINEVDADQVSTDSAEFIELYDGGAGNTDLSGLSLVLYNGSDDLSYIAFDLDGQSTDGDGYFVLCGNAANVASCDLDVSPDTNLIQNGADAVALLAGDAVNYPNDTALPTDGDIIDAIVYDTDDSDDAGLLVLLNAGQPQINERGGGDGTGHSNQRCPNGSGGARNTDTYTQAAPTPGATNCQAPPPPPIGICGDPATFIHEVQGAGMSSPIDGTAGVIIEGVVVGDFQGGSELRGFFLQEEDSDADADPATSEGVFVFDDYFGPGVDVGDIVRVQGTVDEFFGLTQLTSITAMVDCDATDTASAAVITLPHLLVDDWEATEGMAIIFPQMLYATGNYTQARYGEVDLSVGGPLDNPTNVVAPGAPANAMQAVNNVSRIQLDDGSTVQNPWPLPPYLGVDGTLRTGDSVSGLTGVLGYAFGNYEVHPTSPVSFVRENHRPVVAPDVGSALLSIAGFNVLNYFTTLDDSGPICGPAGTSGCRGAENADEFDHQKAKLVAALSTLDADVVGLVELENAVGDIPIKDLVDGINAVAGPGTFAYIPTGAIGTDAIRVGIIYKPSAVSPWGVFGILDSSVDPTFLDNLNRPALAQTFEENITGERFTIAVNHLKSKGSNCNGVGDPDTGDGQGNCNLVRTTAAIALVNWLATDPTGSGDSDFLIMGDLNAYAMEDPVTMIEAGGYTDLMKLFVGSGFTAGAYSFNFFAQSGYLDHALASPAMTPEVSGAAFWHINSDEPSGLDYKDYNQDGLYNRDQYRSSDHDAIVVGLLMDEDEDGVWDGTDMCPGTEIPESVPTNKLGHNRYALVDGDGVFDTTPPKGVGPLASFDIFDTAGCSCEQIIAVQELGKGHEKFGCSLGEMEEWVEYVGLP